MEELKIDAEFEAKCPPLTEEEFEQLEENIVDEGVVLLPIIVWDGTIIDGHNRWRSRTVLPSNRRVLATHIRRKAPGKGL